MHFVRKENGFKTTEIKTQQCSLIEKEMKNTVIYSFDEKEFPFSEFPILFEIQ